MIGGWPAPWGIEYRVDVLNAFVLFLVSAVAAVIVPFARRSVAFEIEDDKQAWFYCHVPPLPHGPSRHHGHR